MSLVAYPSSDSESSNDHRPDHHRTHDEELQNHTAKRRKTARDSLTPSSSTLPPLPSSFHDLYATTPRLSTRDDSSLHSGRKRTTPHIEGNWPTHVYLEWRPTPHHHHLLTTLLAAFSAAHTTPINKTHPPLQALHTNDLSLPTPLHISLSRALSVPSAQRPTFDTALEAAIRRARVRRPLRVSPTSRGQPLRWFANADRTRWFLVLAVQDHDDNDGGGGGGGGDGGNLAALLRASNASAAAIGMPGLYSSEDCTGGGVSGSGSGSASGDIVPLAAATSKKKKKMGEDNFHISIAWTAAEPPDIDIDIIGINDDDDGDDGDSNEKKKALRSAVVALRAATSGDDAIEFDCVKLKSGNAVRSIGL